MSLVQPEFGPTLPQLLAPLPRAARVAIVATVALLIGAAAVLVLSSRAVETNTIVRGPATFNLTYGPQLRRVSEPGALLALRREQHGLFLDAYVVRPLTLKPYRGAPGGVLPAYASHRLDDLHRRYGAFDLALEGRTRINNAAGYQLVLRAKRGARTLYVRELLLVPDTPENATRGLVVDLESTPAAGTPNAVGIGNAGPLKQAMRSLRFGTSREGGTQ